MGCLSLTARCTAKQSLCLPAAVLGARFLFFSNEQNIIQVHCACPETDPHTPLHPVSTI